MSEAKSSGQGQTLDAEKKNGVYLLGIDSHRIGYLVGSGSDKVTVEKVTIHGHHIGTSGYFETECTDFEITEDGTLDLRYRDSES